MFSSVSLVIVVTAAVGPDGLVPVAVIEVGVGEKVMCRPDLVQAPGFEPRLRGWKPLVIPD